MSLITVIGRGHSGTRAIAHTLYASGVYMGGLLNASGDLVPPEKMYEACSIISEQVQWEGGLDWNFDTLHTLDIPPQFTELVTDYLASVLKNKSEHRGWKIPETTLVFPWIVRMFPEIKYIFWIRNPRDCILSQHFTDDLGTFGIQYPPTDDVRLQRAISWKYQYDLIQSTPKPRHWIEVRLEDFILRQDETLERLEEFLGIRLAKIIVRPEVIDRWKYDEGVNYYDFFAPTMQTYGYEIPELS